MQQATIRGLSHLRRRQVRQAKLQGQRHTCTNHPRGPGTSAQTPDRKRRRGHSNRCTSRQVDPQGRHARRIHQLVPGRVREMLSKFWTKLARTPRNAMAHDILGRLHHAALQKCPPAGPRVLTSVGNLRAEVVRPGRWTGSAARTTGDPGRPPMHLP